MVLIEWNVFSNIWKNCVHNSHVHGHSATRVFARQFQSFTLCFGILRSGCYKILLRFTIQIVKLVALQLKTQQKRIFDLFLYSASLVHFKLAYDSNCDNKKAKMHSHTFVLSGKHHIKPKNCIFVAENAYIFFPSKLAAKNQGIREKLLFILKRPISNR